MEVSCGDISFTVDTLLTGGPAKPAGPGGPTSPRSPCEGAEEMVSPGKTKIDSGDDFLSFFKKKHYCYIFRALALVMQ